MNKCRAPRGTFPPIHSSTAQDAQSSPSNLPNGEKCPQKEPVPQLKKIRWTIREKSLFFAPDY